jgi:hypothetical protein
MSLFAGQPGGHGAEQGGDQWFVVCEKAKTSLFQQKYRTALKAASSSLLKVEYRVPGPDTFFE